MANKRTYHGDTNPYTILSDEDVKKIQETAFKLMWDIGLKFDIETEAIIRRFRRLSQIKNKVIFKGDKKSAFKFIDCRCIY